MKMKMQCDARLIARIKKQVKELYELASKGLYPMNEYRKDIDNLRRIPSGAMILQELDLLWWN